MNWSRRTTSLALAALMLLASGLTGVEGGGGAGRTRPGGGGSAGGSSTGAGHAAGRASYGYGHSGHHHGGYYGYGGYYGHLGYYYGPYYPYSWWHWGWATVPYYAVPYAFAVDDEAPGAIETDIDPKRASVIVDGEWLGQARDYNGRFDPLWLEPGTHEVEFSRAGYMTLRRTIRVRPGMLARIEERLQEGAGEDPRSDPARPPSHPLVADRSIHETTVDVEESSGVSRGLLRLRVEPPDAAIYLDGEFLARGEELSRLHGALPVATGIHRLEVVRPGYESRELEVLVSGGDPTRVEIELQRNE